ncbi:hypothetical protein ACFVWT_04450 [Arthrobacter sp. NPDC058288]|uniref:hypothetical protein n=1 Tax=Arthrobacter sp. NPDC058288 TaxID=3346424 RepID=UPI0036F070F9
MEQKDFIAANWPAFVSIAAVFSAVWALSLKSLKDIRDSVHADAPTRDAAAAAIIALGIVGSIGASGALGFAFLPNGWGFVLGAGIFLIPFIAMCVIYFRLKHKSKRQGATPDKGPVVPVASEG